MELMEQFTTYFDVWYLIIIVLGGKLITDDRFVIKKPFWLRAVLLKITAAWRIFIFSFIVGVIMFKFDDSVQAKVLIATFLFANSFYALIGKFIFNWIDGLLKGKGE